MVAFTFNSCTWDAKSRGLWVWDHPELHHKTLFWNKKSFDQLDFFLGSLIYVDSVLFQQNNFFITERTLQLAHPDTKFSELGRENLLPHREKQVAASGSGKDSNGWLTHGPFKGSNTRKAKKRGGLSIPTYLQMVALAVSNWLGGKQRKWGDFQSCSLGPFYEVGCLWSHAWWVERPSQDDQSETLWDSMLFYWLFISS